CSSVLDHFHDVQDAVQATAIIVGRKIHTVRDLNAAKPHPKRNQERRLPARYWLCRNQTGRRKTPWTPLYTSTPTRSLAPGAALTASSSRASSPSATTPTSTALWTAS